MSFIPFLFGMRDPVNVCPSSDCGSLFAFVLPARQIKGGFDHRRKAFRYDALRECHPSFPTIPPSRYILLFPHWCFLLFLLDGSKIG